MDETNKYIKLLFIGEQSAFANILLAKLRADGWAIKAQNADTQDSALEQICNQQWDLILGHECGNIVLDELLQAVSQYNLASPFICILEEGSALDALSLLELGACDVLNESHEQKILIALKREIEHFQDKKKLHALQLDFSELEKRHIALLDQSNIAIAYVLEGAHLYCNQAYADLFDYGSIDAITTVPLIDLFAQHDSAQLKEFLNTDIAHEKKISLQAQLQSETLVSIELTANPAQLNDTACLQLSLKQISGNAQYNQDKETIESQDLLTSLCNRSHFKEKIENAIACAIKQDQLSSLIIVQINEFVDIKSTIGKSKANLLLNDISQFLQSSIKNDYSAARLDEYAFGLLLDNSSPQEAIELAGFIKEKVNNHISTTALPMLQVTCSIGLAAINGHALDAEDILSRAQVNLNASLPDNKPTTDFRINDSMNHKVNDMIRYLNLALEENRFKLLFQPLVNIKGTGSDGYEVLTRMLDSDGNDIPPNQFIPLANLNGMGEKIDRAVVKAALKRLTPDQASHRLVITVTNNSLVSPTFLPWLSEQLKSLHLSSELLIFQMSEIDICNSLEQSVKFCRGLEELGIEKAVCHFGCAIKPLEYLDQIEPSYVKLDTAIIRDIIYSSHQKQSVKELISELHSKGYKVVAPQVEEVDLLPLLWGIGIDFAQGYCLQAPSQEMNYQFIQTEEITLQAPQQSTNNS